jgi:hypothetical protein
VVKNKRRREIALFCAIMAFLTFFSSCAKEPVLPPIEEQPPTDPKPVVVYYQYKYVKAPYVRGYPDEWLTFFHETFVTESPAGRYEQIPWSEELGVEPGDRIVRIEERPSSHIHVSEEVYAFFESGSTAKRAFLIQHYDKSSMYELSAISARDERYAEWCETTFKGGYVSEKTGHIVWTGHAATLLEIAQGLKIEGALPYVPRPIRILICFPSEFNEIYGITMEQARILTGKGLMDGWSGHTEESPLYGLSHAQIAAYLAEHPEILE